MLRRHIQSGVAVIPKSTHIERVEENRSASETVLSQDDVRKMNGMLETIPMSRVFKGAQIR